MSAAVKKRKMRRRTVAAGLRAESYKGTRAQRRTLSAALVRLQEAGRAPQSTIPPAGTFYCGHCFESRGILRRLPPSGDCVCIAEAANQAKTDQALDEWRDAMNGTETVA